MVVSGFLLPIYLVHLLIQAADGPYLILYLLLLHTGSFFGKRRMSTLINNSEN